MSEEMAKQRMAITDVKNELRKVRERLESIESAITRVERKLHVLTKDEG